MLFPAFAKSTAKAHSRLQRCTQCAPPKINAFNSTLYRNLTCKFSHIFRIQCIYFAEIKRNILFSETHTASAQQNLFSQLWAPLLCSCPEVLWINVIAVTIPWGVLCESRSEGFWETYLEALFGHLEWMNTHITCRFLSVGGQIFKDGCPKPAAPGCGMRARKKHHRLNIILVC